MQYFKEINSFLSSSSFFYTIAIGLDSRYSYVSDNYNRNFALSEKSLLGKHFSTTLHPDDIVICAEAGMKCLQNPGVLIPAKLRKHDGEGGFVITQWEMQGIFSEKNEPEGVFCIGYNITELVSAQTEIETKNMKLSEISFIQSHGVRKPLANIIGISHLLADIEVGPDVRQLHEKLIASANDLDMVIKEIASKAE
ncbi:PAS domain-containing protein [Mucilaginibacter rigui]|uniref:histidine kinase n=1 Tax=Mucilaginibacter rigui TaxID=534635 RepID=A0ABR7X493_9SPHI|nr:PAS domain-containing protein [Mucilaginibacter rigui]MBD1385406.1 PAS domain-containing protein [Mucilaginibacter rigui]